MAIVEYKKDYKDLYLPQAVPAVVEVPPMTFAMVDGKGAPQGEDYHEAISLLYSVSYTIKMKEKNLPDYFEYRVFPLEGLWWIEDGVIDFRKREPWCWTSLMWQPGFVTSDVFSEAIEIAQKKKPELDFSKVRLERFDEGLCVQMMHVGSYADEPSTLDTMKDFIKRNGFVNMTGIERKHHEIYLSDPNKTAPERLRTVLRLPVARK